MAYYAVDPSLAATASQCLMENGIDDKSMVKHNPDRSVDDKSKGKPVPKVKPKKKKKGTWKQPAGGVASGVSGAVVTGVITAAGCTVM